ncbi:transcription factor bHLH68 isoform X2 [Vigna radiata var. radiata]|uniref:Transcription factor bHLH68 isoform X2 n=1 Tax=Vigna radiata var. radiata TaxID=3916 RepID=A0A1S3VBY6_VIGRR|nr:transcription factor bHLH68 isoform X2 [Vigna radiata var. radiata]
MMAGNPNWWTTHPPSLIPPQYVLGSSSSIPFNSSTQNPDQPPPSLSQLLFTGLPGEEERVAFSHFQSKKLDEWNEHMLNPSPINPMVDVIKQEVSQSGSFFHQGHDQEFQVSGAPWSHMLPVSSSPMSSVVASFSSSNNLLDFTYNKEDHRKNQLPDHTSECNNTTATAGVYKKTKCQPSSSQPPLKVRKEKLGDRITALHQLVSPFGKTDTASVLLEAIGYIRFLQGQIEALSSPYLGNGSKNMRNPQSQQVHGERNSVFPEDPGQLLNDNGLKRKGAPNQDAKDKPKDLRSRGLCLVPVSCTQHVGNENGADYWAPAYGSGF